MRISIYIMTLKVLRNRYFFLYSYSMLFVLSSILESAESSSFMSNTFHPRIVLVKTVIKIIRNIKEMYPTDYRFESFGMLQKKKPYPFIGRRIKIKAIAKRTPRTLTNLKLFHFSSTPFCFNILSANILSYKKSPNWVINIEIANKNYKLIIN